MTRAAKKLLTDDDRILWNLVAKSTKPLPGRRLHQGETEAPQTTPKHHPPTSLAETPPKAPRTTMPSYAPPVSQPKRHPPTHLDTPTLDRLAAGRLPIEARVDLHGMTQDEAYSLLYSFLLRAHASGARYVLIITGKGSSSGGDGVLRRMVPGWLSTPSFRAFVSSHDQAARGHGGGGAIYVRLRRNRT